MGRCSLNGAEVSEIHQGYFGEISPNLLCYYRANTCNDEKIKAFADQGARFPVISVMRGYSQDHRAAVLNKEIWTGKAQDICRTIGFEVSRSYASHVEKQLIACYKDRHWIFDEDACYLQASSRRRNLRASSSRFPSRKIVHLQARSPRKLLPFNTQLIASSANVQAGYSFLSSAS
jgi:hypothetical protein